MLRLVCYLLVYCVWCEKCWLFMVVILDLFFNWLMICLVFGVVLRLLVSWCIWIFVFVRKFCLLFGLWCMVVWLVVVL